MKKGYSVENFNALSNDNCIAVDNYNDDNCVCNTPVPYRNIEYYKTKETIGVWKIKNKN